MSISSKWFDFVGVLATDSEFPIGYEFISMEFYPRLHQTQLFARHVTGKNFAIANAYGRLKLGVSGVNVRQIVVLVVDQVQTDDDAVEHGNYGHGVVLLVTYWR
jgi:predicted ATPase